MGIDLLLKGFELNQNIEVRNAKTLPTKKRLNAILASEKGKKNIA
jgi:hypothetical protein